MLSPDTLENWRTAAETTGYKRKEHKKIHRNGPTANRIAGEVKVTSLFNLVFTFGPGKPTPSDPVSPGRPAGPASPFGIKWKKKEA